MLPYHLWEFLFQAQKTTTAKFLAEASSQFNESEVYVSEVVIIYELAI